MIKKVLFVLLLIDLFSDKSLQAVEKVDFYIDKIQSQSWQLDNILVSFVSPYLRFHIGKLSLPNVLSGFQQLDIRCLKFNWQLDTVTCSEGQASYYHPLLKQGRGQFNFSLTTSQNDFTLKKLDFAGGQLSITAIEKSQQWFATIVIQDAKLADIKHLFNITVGKISQGKITATIQLRGRGEILNYISVDSGISQLSLHDQSGKLATDKLNFQSNLTANKSSQVWHWHVSHELTQGELYIEPVYLAITGRKIRLTGKGHYRLSSNTVVLDHILLQQDKIAQLTSSGTILLHPSIDFNAGTVRFNTKNLTDFFNIYVSPFSESGYLTEWKAEGQLKAELKFSQSQLQQASLQFNLLSLQDSQQRVTIDKGQGAIYWSLDSATEKLSRLSWEQLKIINVPFQNGQLNFTTQANKIHLQESANISLWGGQLIIDQFEWRYRSDNLPQLFFQGGIKNIALQQLSKALTLPSLSGNISGYIPGVLYQDKKLTLEGKLRIKLLDGEITIERLTLADLFSDSPRLTMDMGIDQLDLYPLTQKFEIGEIEGKISGFVNNLILENWQPVSFYAWLGTPENDNSNHRISQKAVENIARIGGGGVTDIISKSFLRFFDRFSYDKLGFGCYLHHGVCQLMGVEAVGQGYYIIKGGGLPRIDVIGHNPQLDWDVLIQRLSRIKTTDQIIVK